MGAISRKENAVLGVVNDHGSNRGILQRTRCTAHVDIFPGYEYVARTGFSREALCASLLVYTCSKCQIQVVRLMLWQQHYNLYLSFHTSPVVAHIVSLLYMQSAWGGTRWLLKYHRISHSFPTKRGLWHFPSTIKKKQRKIIMWTCFLTSLTTGIFFFFLANRRVQM